MTRALIAFLCDNFTIFSNFDLPQGEGVKSRTPKARRGRGGHPSIPVYAHGHKMRKKYFGHMAHPTFKLLKQLVVSR